jgi:ubiquinone/menaquinone biosynthesis C-methylase UbiE
MTAFVLRNVSDLSVFFQQAARVLRPGGNWFLWICFRLPGLVSTLIRFTLPMGAVDRRRVGA